MTRFDSIERAVADIAAGKAVVVVDDEDRENEGDLIFAAEKATPELVAFMVRYTSGYLCVRSTARTATGWGSRPCTRQPGQARHAYTVTVDAREGIVPASRHPNRAATMRLLADPTTGANDFTRPGPRRPAAREGGRRSCVVPVTPRRPSTSARMADLRPAGVICEIVQPEREGHMAKVDELRVFAATHDLATDLDRRPHRVASQAREARRPRRRVAGSPHRHGDFTAVGYKSIYDEWEHVALVRGDIAEGDGSDVLVRVIGVPDRRCVSVRCAATAAATSTPRFDMIAQEGPRRRPVHAGPRGAAASV